MDNGAGEGMERRVVVERAGRRPEQRAIVGALAMPCRHGIGRRPARIGHAPAFAG